MATSTPSQQKLLIALESGDFQTALPLLPKDGPPITIGPEGFTPLHYACRHGEPEVARLLIAQYKYSIKSPSKHGHTPVHVAAQYGHTDTLQVTVESSKAIDPREVEFTQELEFATYHGKPEKTPVLTVVSHDHLLATKCLRENTKSSTTCTNQNGETPLHLAAQNGHLEVVKYLVDEEGCPTSPTDEQGRTPLHLAAGCGHLEVVRYLIEEKECDPSTGPTKQWKTSIFNFALGRASLYTSTLHTAASHRHLLVTKYLVKEITTSANQNGETPLHLASQNGQLEVVKYLVDEEGCPTSPTDEQGRTPLYLAAGSGNLEVVRYFIEEEKCDPNSGTTKRWKTRAFDCPPGRTPLHTASREGYLHVVKYLGKSQKFDPWLCIDEDGITPLHLASQQGYPAIVEFLIIECQCSPSCQCKDGMTPLHLASCKGNLEVVKVLVEQGCSLLIKNNKGYTALHIAALYRRLNVLEFFIIQMRCDPNVKARGGSTLLHLAGQQGHFDVVRFLIANGCDPSCTTEDGKTAPDLVSDHDVKFFLALESGDLQTTVELLSKYGPPIAKHVSHQGSIDLSCQDDSGAGVSPLHIVSLCGGLLQVQFLVESGCDPLAKDEQGNTHLHYAALGGNLDVLEYFITERKVDPNTRGFRGWSPLHVASQNGHLDTVKYLSRQGSIDLSCQEDNDLTPLHTASQSGHLPVVQFLVEKGCDPLAKDKTGRTSVHVAALEGSLNVLEFFITERRLDPNTRGCIGWTPLHYASQNGHLNVVKYLSCQGSVDLTCQDDIGLCTSLHMASGNGHLSVVQFLVEKGCDPLAKDKERNTSLHYAALGGNLDVLEFFITERKLDPNTRGFRGWSPLHCASQNGHLVTVKYLSRQGSIDLSCQDDDGFTPLHIASGCGHLSVVRFLVEKGCDPLAKEDEQGITPLHAAASKGELNVLEFFTAEMGLDPSTKDCLGRTPLHCASRNDTLDIVKYLSHQGSVDLSCQNDYGVTPLHIASGYGNISVVQFLVMRGCDPLAKEAQGNTSVHVAAMGGKLNVLKFFIAEKRLDPNSRGYMGMTPLHFASMSGNLDTVKYLSHQGSVDVSCQDDDGITPLHIASGCGNISVVQFLVMRGCDPLAKEAQGNTSVHVAAMGGKLNVLKFFIAEKRLDPNSRGRMGWTPLHCASKSGNIDTVKYLSRQESVDVSLQDDNGLTPLHTASQSGHLPAVQFLVEKGCDPLAKEKAGRTSVHVAALEGNLNVLKFFITERRLDPNTRGCMGWTPLHYASNKGHLETVKYLSHQGSVDVSCHDDDGITPLHIASHSGHLPVVQFLVEKGCDPLAKDKAGRTSVHFAALEGNLNVLEFFITERRVDPNTRGCMGCTPLHYASNKGHLDTVKYLSRQESVDLSLQDDNGLTPLHTASHSGHLPVVQFLVEKGCDPLAKDKAGSTSVHVAALEGNLNVLEFFITERRLDPNTRGCMGWTPLHYASQNGHLNVVKYLSCQGSVDLSCQGDQALSSLHIASEHGHLSVVQFLVEKGCDPLAKEKLGNTSAHYAADTGKLNVLEFFISERRLDPSIRGARGWTLLHLACHSGHLNIVKYLSSHNNVDLSCLDEYGCTPLHNASLSGNLQVVKFLVEHGCNPMVKTEFLCVSRPEFNLTDCKNYSITIDNSTNIISTGSELKMYFSPKSIQEFLPLESASVQAIRIKPGWTPIHFAASSGHLCTVEYLADNKYVDLCCEDKFGFTPIHVASLGGHVNVVQFLVNKGCNPLSRDKQGLTPLHYATVGYNTFQTVYVPYYYRRLPFLIDLFSGEIANPGSNFDTLKYLISVVHDLPLCQSVNGSTPLHYASMSGHLDMVRFLIDKGFGHHSRDKEGNAPVHYAALTGRLNVLKFFLAGADQRCDPVVRGQLGRTVLHLASKEGHLETAKYLTDVIGIAPSLQDEFGFTALDLASSTGFLPVVRLLVEKGCDPSVGYYRCQTPLHHASANGHLDIIEYLTRQDHIDPSCRDADGSTPLHLASENGFLPVVQFLCNENKCNPHTSDDYGSTPIHVAASHGRLLVLKFFVDEIKYDPVVRDDLNRTPLHLASQGGHLDTVKYLISDNSVNPSCKDDNDWTPLHLASQNGHVDTVEYIITALVSKTGMTLTLEPENGTPEVMKHVSPTTSSGETPMSLAFRGHHIDVVLYLHSKGIPLPSHVSLENAHFRSWHPLSPLANIYVIGDQSSGKTQLVRALSAEGSWFGSIRNVSGPPPETAGIIMSEFDSKEYGKVTFFDFAGLLLPEYTEVIFENTSQAVVLLTLDISKDNTSLYKSIQFWRDLLNAVSAISYGCQAYIIIVGSHQDRVSSQDLSSKSTILEQFGHNASPKLNLVRTKPVLLDCRKSSSESISDLHGLLKKLCTIIRVQEQYNYKNGSFLVAYINEYLPEEYACTVEQLLASLSKLDDQPEILDPLMELDKLHETCEQLTKSGHLLLLKNDHNPSKSWLVLKKEVVLSKVLNLLKHMQQQEHFAKLGIVSFSSLQQVIKSHGQQLPIDLAVRYMKKMVFCCEIDPEDLKRIADYSHGHALGSNEAYYLFPSLISVKKPEQVWSPDDRYTYKCGWCLRCTDPEHFFTPRFFKQLQIELVGIALEMNREMLTTLETQKSCRLWRDGIRWLHPDKLEIAIQFSEDRKSLIMMLRSFDDAKVQCIAERSWLIRYILNTIEDHCEGISPEECLLSPHYLQNSSLQGLEVALLPVTKVARAVLKNDPTMAVEPHSSSSTYLSLKELLFLEPYYGLGEELLNELFNHQDVNSCIPDKVLCKLAKALRWETASVALCSAPGTHAESPQDTDYRKCLKILRQWHSETDGTYASLHQHLGKYSIFRERNLLEVAGAPAMQIMGSADDPISAMEHLDEEEGALLQQIPEIHQLWRMGTGKGSPKNTIQVIREVKHAWWHLALNLQFREFQIANIKALHPDNIEKQCYEMFRIWLKGSPFIPEPTTWETLIKGLCRGGSDVTEGQFNQLAKELLQYLTAKPSNDDYVTDQRAPRSKSHASRRQQIAATREKEPATERLHDSGTTVSSIEDSAGDPVEVVQDIFLKWLKGEGRQPATWKVLIEVLQDCDPAMMQLAADIAKVKTSSV